MRKVFLIFVFVVSTLLPGLTQAVTVQNITTDTIVFFDNFEGVSPVSHAPGYDTSVIADPVAVVGTWQNVSPSSPYVIQVKDDSIAPDPGPAEGNQYLQIFRDSTFQSNELDGILAMPQDTDGDVIQLRTMIYVDNAAVRIAIALSSNFSTEGADLQNSARALIYTDGAGHVTSRGPGNVNSNSGVPYTPGVWQEWALTYQIGQPTFTLSIDGITSGPLDSPSGAGTVAGVWLSNGNPTPGGSAYLDAVPVPIPIVAGDYNGNGTVDAADYVLWRKGGPLLNEVHNPGTATQEDYNEWRARFGNNTPESGSGALESGAVPEPTSMSLMGAAICLWATLRRQRAMCVRNI